MNAIKNFLFLSLIIACVPMQADSFFDKASAWAENKTNWAKDKANWAKNKVRSVVNSEINTVEELSKNVARVVGGGTMIIFGCYLAHHNLIQAQQNFSPNKTIPGLLGVAIALAGIHLFADGAKELSEKKINFEAIARDAKRHRIITI